MKKIILTGFVLAQLQFVQSQVITIATGSSLTVKSNSSIYIDGLILTPTADYTLTANSISRNATITNPALQNYVARVFKLGNTTAPFTGSLQVNYLDAELNGIPEASLKMNIHNGIIWADYNSTVNTTANYVLSSSINALPLNEIALASSFAPLPLTWLSFAAVKSGNNVLLQWKTAMEVSTKDFEPQHSTNGLQWQTLSTLPAHGNMGSVNVYDYTHAGAVKGWNYYRILQRDINNRITYSETRKISLQIAEGFTVVNNPVTNKMLLLDATAPVNIKLFQSDGRLLLTTYLNAGRNTVSLDHLPTGIYIVASDHQSVRFLLN